eukprot:gene19168-25777_t
MPLQGDFDIISNSGFASGIGMVENAMHEQAAANSSLDSIEDQVGAASGADDSLGGVDQVENGRAFNPFAAYLPGGAEAEFERGVAAAAVGDSLGEIGQGEYALTHNMCSITDLTEEEPGGSASASLGYGPFYQVSPGNIPLNRRHARMAVETL